jgi:hypothetical protein
VLSCLKFGQHFVQGVKVNLTVEAFENTTCVLVPLFINGLAAGSQTALMGLSKMGLQLGWLLRACKGPLVASLAWDLVDAWIANVNIKNQNQKTHLDFDEI